MEDEEARLLDILEAHGRLFLNSFDLNEPPLKKKRTKESREQENEDFEEWRGFHSTGSYSPEENKGGEDEDDDFSYECNDDDLTASSSAKMPDIVVFSDLRQKRSDDLSSRTQKKAFMSSKVTNVTSVSDVPRQGQDDRHSDGEDISNAQNDALLHHLVHTKLLSGSLNPELNLTHAQREKALSGRVLEVAGGTKLGRGEAAIRAAERNKASKRVREGLLRKKNEREKQQLEEAKNLGNYHPALKKLFGSSCGSSNSKRRVRGLGMGIGRFSGGTLKLSKEEIGTVTGRRVHGTSRQGHKSSRGRK